MDEGDKARVGDALRLAIDERVTRAMLAQVALNASTSAATTEKVSITFGDVARLRQETLARMGRVPRAIWFVDREVDLGELLYELRNLTEPSPFSVRGDDPGWIGTVYGIPLRAWRRAAATAEERAAAPWFVDRPGVWVEMVDGKHQRLG